LHVRFWALKELVLLVLEKSILLVLELWILKELILLETLSGRWRSVRVLAGLIYLFLNVNLRRVRTLYWDLILILERLLQELRVPLRNVAGGVFFLLLFDDDNFFGPLTLVGVVVYPHFLSYWHVCTV